jgi:hypothetical protein
MRDPKKDTGRRLTFNEWMTLYLLDTDDVPDGVRELFWALTTRHLQLIDIKPQDLIRYKRRVRDIIRVSKWRFRKRGFVAYDLEKQVEFFATDVLLRKSLFRGERELLATEIKKMEIKETESAPNKGIRATLSKLFGGGTG